MQTNNCNDIVIIWSNTWVSRFIEYVLPTECHKVMLIQRVCKSVHVHHMPLLYYVYNVCSVNVLVFRFRLDQANYIHSLASATISKYMWAGDSSRRNS